jgi:tetratricopeptide (TPR) repeat protein
MGDLPQALEYNRQGLDIALEINDPYYQAEGQLDLGEICLAMGNAELAVENLRRGMDLAGAIRSQELVVRALRDLAEAYDLAGQRDLAQNCRDRSEMMEQELTAKAPARDHG